MQHPNANTATALLAAVLVATGPALVDATCYKSGTNWPNQSVASNHAHNACFGWADGSGNHVRGAFENVFFLPHSQSPNPATVYVNLDGGKHVIFQITNQQNFGITINADVCFDGLLREIQACGKGGESTHDGWTFRSDPEDGSC